MALFTKKQHAINYLIVYVAYAMGGVMFFYLKPLPKIVFFIFLLIILLFRNKIIQYKFYWVIALIGILFLIQKFQFKIGTFYNFAGFISMFGIAYLLIRLLKEHFISYYINVVYFFCYISLAFWLFTNLIPGFYELTIVIAKKMNIDPSIQSESFIIYAVEPYVQYLGIRRNNGGFWEPGVYATWLSFALFFSVIKNSFNHKKSWVILTTLLTTMSTSGFAALFLILAININTGKIEKVTRLILQLCILLLITAISFSFDFLAPKVIQQIKYESNLSLNTPTSGRILSARKSLVGLSNHPFFGKGLVETRYTEKELYENVYIKEDIGQYGLLGMLQRTGLIFFILFIIPIYKGIRLIVPTEYRNVLTLFYCFMIYIVLMLSQALYWTPVALYIFWFSILLKEKKM
jgi:hypothetical protein